MNNADCLAEIDRAVAAVSAAKNWKCSRTDSLEEVLSRDGVCHAQQDVFGRQFSGQMKSRAVVQPETPEGETEPPPKEVQFVHERYRAQLGYSLHIRIGTPAQSLAFAEAVELELQRRFADSDGCEMTCTVGDVKLTDQADALGKQGVALLDVMFEGGRHVASADPVIGSIDLQSTPDGGETVHETIPA